jgi:uncharacterized protein (TIGR04255 family)
MGKPLKNAPVYFVIGQVRFNPQLKPIQESMTQIQEGFRQLGYTDYRHQILNQIEIVVEENQVTNKPGAQVNIYDFANAERDELFRLEANQLSFHTVNYQTFETLLGAFAKALEILIAYTQLDFIERVGLRFLNAVMCREDEDVATYLQPQLLGLSTLADDLVPEFCGIETLLRKGGDSILARVVIQQGRVGFPADLSNTGLEIAQHFRDFKGQFAVLDNDAFHLERVKYQDESTADDIIQTLRRLKVLLDSVFVKSVTDEAMSIWREEA